MRRGDGRQRQGPARRLPLRPALCPFALPPRALACLSDTLRGAAQKPEIQEVLPKAGLVVSEKGNLAEVRGSALPRWAD